MNMPTPTVRMSRKLLCLCEAEVSNTFPLESGGVLMGRRLDKSLWQIDHVIGPGTNAVHGRFHFIPDLQWQHERIAERFYETNGRSTYLGDWHSHPSASHGKLSQKDKDAIKTIIQAPEAKCESPLMMILWSGEPEWHAQPWIGRIRENWLRLPQLKIRRCQFQFE